MLLWWTRRESNPRPKIPTAGIYVCSRCLSVARAFPTDRGLEPSFVRFRLRYDALLRLADFRSFTPANHRLGFWRTSLAYAARASLLGLAVFVSPGFTRPPATSTRSLAFANPRRSRDAPKQANCSLAESPRAGKAWAFWLGTHSRASTPLGLRPRTLYSIPHGREEEGSG